MREFYQHMINNYEQNIKFEFNCIMLRSDNFIYIQVLEFVVNTKVIFLN